VKTTRDRSPNPNDWYTDAPCHSVKVFSATRTIKRHADRKLNALKHQVKTVNATTISTQATKSGGHLVKKYNRLKERKSRQKRSDGLSSIHVRKNGPRRARGKTVSTTKWNWNKTKNSFETVSKLFCCSSFRRAGSFSQSGSPNRRARTHTV